MISTRNFRVDRASIILDVLGLREKQGLRQHLAERRKFFDNKDRLQKLKPLVTADNIEVDLDRKMIAVVVKAEQPELFTIIRTLFHAYSDNGDDIDLDTPPPAWTQLEKFELANPFWQMVAATFGYTEDDPSLKKFLLRLLVTDYAHHLKAEVPVALQHLVLPGVGRANAIVCLAQWRDSGKGSSYDRLSSHVAALLNIEEHLRETDLNALIDVMTFQAVEQTVSNGHLGLYRLETQVTAGNGALRTSGLGSNSAAHEAIKVGFDYYKANASRISASIKAGDHDYHLHVVELHNTGPTSALTLSAFVALCSGVLSKPIQQQMVILGSMSLGGNITAVENLAESLQVAFDSGAKRILLPMASVTDIPTIPGELFAKFQTSFYADPTDAVFKALGVH